MAKYDLAEYAAINAKAYRDYLAKHPDMPTIRLTRGQLDAICRDLADYTDRDADARGWAEQATTNAAEIARLKAIETAARRFRAVAVHVIITDGDVEEAWDALADALDAAVTA